MVEAKSLTTALIIAACVLLGVFLATLKNNDRLTARERSALGFFRGLTIWSAIAFYIISFVTFLASIAKRIGLISQDDVFAMLGQPIAMHLEAWGLMYVSAISFAIASMAMVVMLLIAIELHIRRIAEKVDRNGYFNP